MVDSSMVMERLQAVGTRITQPSGAVLFDQGEPGEDAYVLKSGNTRLSLLNDEGTPLWSRTVRPGSILGLPSTLGHTRYSLRATAVGPVELMFVPPPNLEELMRQDTTVGSALLRVVSEELVDLRRLIATVRSRRGSRAR